MDFKDRRIWYAVAAVIIVLIVIGYATGWFSGAPAPAPRSKLHRRMQKDHGESPVVTDDAEPPSSLAQLTAEIVSAYVSHNKVAPSDLATLITTVASQLAKIGTKVEPLAEEKPSRRCPCADRFGPTTSCAWCAASHRRCSSATSTPRTS